MRVFAFCGAMAACAALTASPASAAIYLNQDTGVTVEVGPGTSAGGSSNNTYSYGYGIEKVIDAPSADAEEFHSQQTHIWYTFAPGGGLELRFDLGQSYDISTLHFWNYNGEAYDVDQIDFSFFDAANTSVGGLTINPALGSPGGIEAEDISLAAPLNVRYVTAFLTGTNGQVDFQNMGFTAEVSAVPEPAAWAMMIAGLGFAGAGLRRRGVAGATTA